MYYKKELKWSYMIIWILSNTQIYAIRFFLFFLFLVKEIISAVKENLLKVSKFFKDQQLFTSYYQTQVYTLIHMHQSSSSVCSMNIFFFGNTKKYFLSANFSMFSIEVLLFGARIYIAMLNIHNSIELIELHT